MTTDKFWSLLEGLPGDEPEVEMEERLQSLSPKEIEAFQLHFDRQFARAYDWDLWGAAYLIEGGCSDDGFMDFRYGLIARGRKVFEDALSDPDTLAKVAFEEDDGYIPNENFAYVAMDIYECKTGEEIPRGEDLHPKDPSGEDWNFEDASLCEKKLPKLWKQFGW